MSSNVYGLFDMALAFGAVLAICVWQLRSTERAKRERIEREKNRKPPDAG
jgi:hypothetical protein